MSVDSSRGRIQTLAALAATLALVTAGCSSDPAATPPPPAPPASDRPTVAFVGPERLTGPAVLRARARADGARVVAVTFFLDGRPLGSDTTRPYGLDVDPVLMPQGEHRLRVEAVDSLGRRRSSRETPISVSSSGGSIVEVSPGASFAEARDRLRRGDVTVKLGPGRYEVDELTLGDGARLVGSGSRSVIAPSNRAYWALIVAKGTGIRISDLAIDGGGGMATEDGGIAVAVFDGSRDVRLQRLHIRRVRTHGVNVWGAHRSISVQDSVIESGGGADAGVYTLGSDRSRDTSAIRNRIRGFRSYGILLGQKEFGRRAAALHGVALDNRISDIRDPARDACYRGRAPECGTNEGGIWTGGVEAAIIGNTVLRARWDGIETVGSSTRTTIVRNVIRDTRVGIYLEHSTNDSVIARNLIADTETGINVEWLHEGQGSRRNTFTRNRIVGARESGLFVDVGGDGNRIVENVFVGGARPAITLQGSSGNLVRANVGCDGADGSLVGIESASWDDGSQAHSRDNRFDANRNRSAC